MHDTDITVTTLMPGATKTEFPGKLDVVVGLTFGQCMMMSAVPMLPKKPLLRQMQEVPEICYQQKYIDCRESPSLTTEEYYRLWDGLAVSTHTLQRQLQKEGTSFQQELTTLREERAHHYLANTNYSGAEISFLLGY